MSSMQPAKHAKINITLLEKINIFFWDHWFGSHCLFTQSGVIASIHLDFILEPRVQQGAFAPMGGERHRLEPDRHGRRSVPLLGGVVVGRDQRRDLPRRLRHLLIQPRPGVGPLRRSRLSLELQLFFLQQEAQAHRFLHLQSREVSIGPSWLESRLTSSVCSPFNVDSSYPTDFIMDEDDLAY
jgi:hypothetical protein